MLKAYRIIPSTFILFLFGLTLITVSLVSAQTVDQLIESIEKLDANDRARVLEYKYSPPLYRMAHGTHQWGCVTLPDLVWTGRRCRAGVALTGGHQNKLRATLMTKTTL